MRRDFRQLREVLDGNDSFVSGGHQIIKTAGATKHAERMLKVPVWAKDDRAIQDILLKAFPKLRTDETQRFRAARWARVINLYYRMGMTEGAVAGEMGLEVPMVHDLIHRIRRVAEGKSTKGTERKKMGRPKSPEKSHTDTNL